MVTNILNISIAVLKLGNVNTEVCFEFQSGLWHVAWVLLAPYREFSKRRGG